MLASQTHRDSTSQLSACWKLNTFPASPLMQFHFCSHHPDHKRTSWKSWKRHQEDLFPQALRDFALSLCLMSLLFFKTNCKIQQKARECPALINSAQITKNWSSVEVDTSYHHSLSNKVSPVAKFVILKTFPC